MKNGKKNKPDNIIVIVADSLRYNTVYADGSPGLPYIEKNSTIFKEARSAGCWTLPGTASMFTGLMPHRHGATSQTRQIHPEIPTLAEMMKKYGYKTHQVTANVATTEVFGLDRGFDEVHKIWQSVKPKFKAFMKFFILLSKPRVRKIIMSKDKIVDKLSQDLEMGNSWLQNTYPDIFDKTREIITTNERNGDKSFIFLNLMESHFPYHAFPKMGIYSKKLGDKVTEMVALYHTVNQSFLKSDKRFIGPKGRSIIEARQRKSWEIIRGPLDEFARELHENKNNTVVFMSDHGDNFGEQNWFYHFSNVTDAGNKVPMFWLDNEASRTGVNDRPVSSRFIFSELMRTINSYDGPGLFEEASENLPVMQSYWYNNMGRTLDKYIYNQFAFMNEGMRYANRNGQWLSAPPSTVEKEPVYEAMTAGVNPIEDCVEDKVRKEYLTESFKDFSVFSEKIIKKPS